MPSARSPGRGRPPLGKRPRRASEKGHYVDCPPSRTRCREETSHVPQHIDLAEPAIFTTSSVKTTPRVGARPSTRSSPRIARSTSPGASTAAATRSIASLARSRLLTLTFDISQLPGPRNWAIAGGSNGCPAVLARPQLTPGLISLLRGTAELPPFTSFSTSYPELDSAVRRPIRRIGNGGGNFSRSPKLPCSWFGGCDEG